MRDIVFLAIMLAFFALCVVLVRACDQMIGSGEIVETDSDADAQSERIPV